jgi:hypothetical protein
MLNLIALCIKVSGVSSILPTLCRLNTVIFCGSCISTFSNISWSLWLLFIYISPNLCCYALHSIFLYWQEAPDVANLFIFSLLWWSVSLSSIVLLSPVKYFCTWLDLFVHTYIHYYFPKIPHTGVYPMDVGIVSKLALWYSKAIDLKLKLTIGHKQIQ